MSLLLGQTAPVASSFNATRVGLLARERRHHSRKDWTLAQPDKLLNVVPS